MQQLIDSTILHTLNILKLDEGTRQQVLTLLNRMQNNIFVELASANMTAWKRERLSTELASINKIISSYYDEVRKVTTDAMEATASATAKSTKAALDGVLVDTEVALPSPALLTKLAKNTLIQGGVVGDWLDNQASWLRFNLANVIRQGIANGEASGTMISRLRETMQVSRSNAAALVQTSVISTMNQTNMEIYEQNKDVVKGFSFLATLDSHTCVVCGTRDGLEWDGDKKPRGHSYGFVQPPMHFNCRCMITPIVDLPFKLPEGERVSSAGYQSAKTTFAQFLARQSPEFQDEVLGKGRAEMYRAGKITLQDLITKTGKPLTIAELHAKYD